MFRQSSAPSLLFAVFLTLAIVACGQEPPTPASSTTVSSTAGLSATLTSTPKPIATPTPLPTVTATPIPAATFTPSPTHIPGRLDLYEIAQPPEHMAYIYWEWDSDTGNRPKFRELTVDFKVHNDVGNWSDRHGLYLMLGFSYISDVPFYYGIQTHAYDESIMEGDGKGLIFSRWETRDLENARVAPDGWSQSSGHEGDFVGVRCPYSWTEGPYRVRLAPDGTDDDGEWWGIWVTDLKDGSERWCGSLRFPFEDDSPGTTWVAGFTYTTSEIYGKPIRPVDIPTWTVTVQRPLGDGIPSSYGDTGYMIFTDTFKNAEIRYDPQKDGVVITVGGTTERQTEPQTVLFK